MDNGNGGYPGRLRAAIEQGHSRRKLAGLLAAETGNKEGSEYRALGKYLKGQEEPDPERAAILAVLLGTPQLALVSPVAARRKGRQAELEGLVEELVLDVRDLVVRVEGLGRQVAELEGLARPGSARGRKA